MNKWKIVSIILGLLLIVSLFFIWFGWNIIETEYNSMYAGWCDSDCVRRGLWNSELNDDGQCLCWNEETLPEVYFINASGTLVNGTGYFEITSP